MNLTIKYIRLLVAVILISLAHTSIASFTGSADDRNKNKYSLKNLNKFSKNYSLSVFRTSTFQFKNFYHSNPFGSDATSFLSLQRGNTTYIYPYNYKVKVPRFKTPVPPQR